MSMFQKKGPYDIDNDGLNQTSRKKPVSRETKRLAMLLLLNTLIALIVYFGCIALYFTAIFFVYIVAAAILLIVYFIYNQGFVLRGATPEMLDDALTPEQKQAMLDDATRRMKASRWMLTVIIPLIVAVLADFLYVYLLADLLEMLGITF